jgi:dolichol kinase
LLILQWPLILGVGVTSIDVLARGSSALNGGTGTDPRTAARVKVLYRKAFHVLAVALFVPPLLSRQEVVLSLALVAAALVFMVVETCRLCGTPWLASRLNVFMRRYLDKRENTERGDLVLTHLYLLMGCAFPVWLELGSSATGVEPRAPSGGMDLLRRAAGILLIGVGDACAAAYGINFGKIHWPCSHRTVEGSFAFVVSIMTAALALSLSQTVGTVTWQVGEIKAFACAVALSMFLEVYTDSIDNLVLPLYFSPTLRILTRAMK